MVFTVLIHHIFEFAITSEGRTDIFWLYQSFACIIFSGEMDNETKQVSSRCINFS